MFIGDEVLLDITFPVARAGLARLALGGLLSPAQEAYRHGSAGLERASWPGPLALTQVQARSLARARDRAGLAIRWEAAGAGGQPFVVLDADLGLLPVGDLATLLTLAGTYRAPSAAPDQAPDRAVLRQVAAATIRGFLSRLAAGVTGQPGPVRPAAAPPAPGHGTDGPQRR